MTVLTVSLDHGRRNVRPSLRGDVLLGEATSVPVEPIGRVDVDSRATSRRRRQHACGCNMASALALHSLQPQILNSRVEHYLLRRDGCPCRTRILRNEDVLTFVLSGSSSLVFGGIERDPLSTKGFVVAPNCIDSVLAVCSNPERGHTWLSEVDVGGMSEVVARTGTELESLVIEEVNDETLQGTGMFVKDSP
jgi:hypothetical protein